MAFFFHESKSFVLMAGQFRLRSSPETRHHHTRAMAKKKTTATSKQSKPPTIPISNDAWKQDFIGASMRSHFSLNLSQAMLEFLCAVADGVTWDRQLYFQSLGSQADTFLATSRALEKRGLIVRLPRGERLKEQSFCESSCWELTPAGEKVVDLLKLVGLFIEADAAISKKARS